MGCLSVWHVLAVTCVIVTRILHAPSHALAYITSHIAFPIHASSFTNADSQLYHPPPFINVIIQVQSCTNALS